MFESDIDFINHVRSRSERDHQIYILDYMSLRSLKDKLLVNQKLIQSTYELAYWGRNEKEVKSVLQLSNKHGFNLDHVLVPYNYSVSDKVPVENMRIGVLPTTITMNHVKQKNLDTHSLQHCDAFFMGKAPDQVEHLRPLIKIIEEKLFEMEILTPQNVTMCTGMKLSANTDLDKFLGFSVRHTINLGTTNPEVFASIVGSARVVVGSGKPKNSPTITDTIFGGGIFIAPSVQFGDMEDFPLFIKTESYGSREEQADEIVRLILDKGEKQRFGGYIGTSYNIESVCKQFLGLIEKSM